MESLLISLRDRVLDEDEPLAGLLRKCLILGAESGSQALRDWARQELNGYLEDAPVPDYRRVPVLAFQADTISGYNFAKNMTYSKLNLPVAAQKYVPDDIEFREPIEELSQLATQKSLNFRSNWLSAVEATWNQELDDFQQVVNMRLPLSPSVLTGILGQIRTRLTDLVADLTASTPATEIPSKSSVDRAVLERLQNVASSYTTNIHNPSGPVAIGNSATAISNPSIAELLSAVRELAPSVIDEASYLSDLQERVADLELELAKPKPSTAEAMKKTGKLSEIAEKIGIGSLSAIVGSVVASVTKMALGGEFG